MVTVGKGLEKKNTKKALEGIKKINAQENE